jgi:hypothetical protein
VDEWQCITTDGNGNKSRLDMVSCQSPVFAKVQVLTLSRRKHGFDSRRARQASRKPRQGDSMRKITAQRAKLDAAKKT